MRQVLNRLLPQAHRHGVEGVYPQAPLVLFVAQRIRWFVWGADPTRPEGEPQGYSPGHRADRARREGGTLLRPPLLAVEENFVPVRAPRLQVRDVYQGVVVALDVEGTRAMARPLGGHLHLARRVG